MSETGPVLRQDAGIVNATTAASVAINDRMPPSRTSRRRSDIRHFFIIGGSSTQRLQNPLGFLLVAFFTTVTFIVVSYATALAASCASEMSADSKLRL